MLATILSPVVEFLVKKGMNRIIAIGLAITTLIALATLIIGILASQVMQFSDSFQTLLDRFQEMMHQLTAWISQNINVSEQKLNSWIMKKKNDMINGSTDHLGQTLLQTGSILVIIILIPVYTVMILYYKSLLLNFLHMFFRSANKKGLNDVLVKTKKVIQSYLIGLLLEAGIVATLYTTSLLLIGIEYSLLLGMIGAVLNLIPYIGGVVGAAIPMAIALATKDSPSYCFFVLGAYILIQFIDNNYIVPKIVASKVKLNALLSVIAVLVGGALWGIPGMFLSIPLTAIIKVICDHIEPLKPMGFLLGNTVPAPTKISHLKPKK